MIITHTKHDALLEQIYSLFEPPCPHLPRSRLQSFGVSWLQCCPISMKNRIPSKLLFCKPHHSPSPFPSITLPYSAAGAPVTAPVCAEPTCRWYFASTPRGFVILFGGFHTARRFACSSSETCDDVIQNGNRTVVSIDVV